MGLRSEGNLAPSLHNILIYKTFIKLEFIAVMSDNGLWRKGHLMSYTLTTLPQSLKDQGWKVKIRDKERAEPPHVSIIKKQETWRWGLREQAFLNKLPPSRQVPAELLEHIKSNLDSLIKTWNQMYPYNPVSSENNL